MTDLISNMHDQAGLRRSQRDAQTSDVCVPNPDGHTDVVAFIELLFFAYRDFVHDPDAILEEYGFGRAHHRVLHFVYRHPAIRVSRLLTVLNITKQSLARVLKQLIEDNFVEQRAGENDKRERRLFLTPEGVALFERLVAPQRARVAEALATAGADIDHAAVQRFLHAMIAPGDRDTIQQLIDAGAPVGEPNAEAA